MRVRPDCSAVELGFITYGAPAPLGPPAVGERHAAAISAGDEGTVWLTRPGGMERGRRRSFRRNAGRVRGLARRHPFSGSATTDVAAQLEQWKRAEDDLEVRTEQREQRQKDLDQAVMIGRPYHLSRGCATYW